MPTKIMTVAALALLAGCMEIRMEGPVKPAAVISASFDPGEVDWFQQSGKAAISGTALLRTVGGDVKTCAGLSAHLIPASHYADERMALMFHSDHGLMTAAGAPNFVSTNFDYTSHQKTVRCDAQGNFMFEELPAGVYYVTAEVEWGAPTGYGISKQGGVLMQKVFLRDGQRAKLILTE